MRAVLLTCSFVVEVADDDVEQAAAERLVARFAAAFRAEHPDADASAGWQSMRFDMLAPAQLNCGRCATCGGWVTDRERPEPAPGLCNGATVEGRLLCDEHLPPDHRWAF